MASASRNPPLFLPAREWGSRDETAFQQLEILGEGTYGMVFKMKDLQTHEICALKKIRMEGEKEGFPMTALREIRILKALRHPNIVELKEIVRGIVPSDSKNEIPSFYLSFECLDHDLAGLLESPAKTFITEPVVKCYFKQLLEGLHYLHSNRIIHRDLKTANILLSHDGILKICDFGLARPIITDENQKYTNKVITLWYRPPELLLGAVVYGPEVDIWSAGCILFEMLEKKPLFPAENENEALDKIFQIIGTPTAEEWPQLYKMLAPHQIYKPSLRTKFPNLPPLAATFIERLLKVDPKKRISAHDALDHDWLWKSPSPCEPHEIPKFKSSFDIMYRKSKRRRNEEADGEPSKKKFRRDQEPQLGSSQYRLSSSSIANVPGAPSLPPHPSSSRSLDRNIPPTSSMQPPPYANPPLPPHARPPSSMTQPPPPQQGYHSRHEYQAPPPYPGNPPQRGYPPQPSQACPLPLSENLTSLVSSTCLGLYDPQNSSLPLDSHPPPHSQNRAAPPPRPPPTYGSSSYYGGGPKR